tara:strand:- start:65664 stop:67232 length:1569 start_codon:yes stop_codon:yes gene_type:complete
MKNKSNLLPIYFAVFALFGLCIGMFLDFPMKKLGLSANEAREKKVKQIINYVDFEYVDKVNTDSLLDLTITDLLKRLDPHSSYIPLEEVEKSDEGIKGSFDGIGIEFKIFRDTLIVVKVIEGGPSSKAGLRAGQRILFANDERLFGADITNQYIIGKLKGESGSKVVLDLWDKTNKESGSIKKTVVRGKVPLKSLAASFLINDSVGYLKLLRFAQTSKDEVHTALKELKKGGAKNIIFDLRDNPGGLLSAANSISDEFLEEGKLIVFTKDRKDKKRETYSTKKGLFKNGSIAVIINEGSASASEIVAGALQDNDRAIIVGRKSFGKGLVQEEITLEDGSKIRLTTQRYYTPTGRSIQKPYADYDERYIMGMGYDQGLPNQDSLELNVKFTTPGGKVVFGGGGIQPDVLVPFDTSRQATLLYHLALRANMANKAFSYVDQNRNSLKDWTKAEFVEAFNIDSEILEFFFNAFSDKIMEMGEEVVAALKLRIKANIAANMYGNSAYLEVYHQNDPLIKKALESLN